MHAHDDGDLPIYELRGVSKIFGRGPAEVRALRDVDLTINAGELVALVGPSGSGKTTLLQLLGGLDRPTTGEVLFEGREMAELRDAELAALRLGTIGFVFQQFNLIPTLTAAQNIEVALAPRGMKGEPRRDAARSLLDSVGLGSRAGHLPSQLSGGEQQRVAIARALANSPRVVLADEPTGNLDSTTGDEIIDALTSLSDERRQTVVLITHDGAIAKRARRIVQMQDGSVAGAAAAASNETPVDPATPSSGRAA
jgi:putative ABC transport system ATP-binding protein